MTMRNRRCPSTVQVHARVCTYSAPMDGRGRMDAHRYTSPPVTSERTSTMTAYQPDSRSRITAGPPERR